MSSSRRTFALLVPFVMIAALIGGIQPAVAQAVCVYLPDAAIRGGPADLSYRGNDVYNHNGSLQSLQRVVRPGFGDQFNIRMQNDGNCLDSLVVHGAGNSMKYKITYWSGPLNVTADVVSGTFETGDLNTGESEYLLAFIYVRKGTRSGSSMTDQISVASMTAKSLPTPVLLWDVVGAKVHVDRKAGDFNSQCPIP
jgi:hypothetical protein